MGFPFVRKYLPISQKDIVDGSQDIEEGGSSASSEFEPREKDFTLPAKPSVLSLWTRWLPWLICLCLLLSNIHTWVKLNASEFPDAVYCKSSKRPRVRFHVLTFPSQHLRTSRLSGKMSSGKPPFKMSLPSTKGYRMPITTDSGTTCSMVSTLKPIMP